MNTVSAYQIALIGGGFTILGVLIGSMVGYWFSRILAAYNATNSAKTKLRTSFAPAIAHLKFPQSLGNIEAKEFFDSALTNHAISIEEFRPFASDGVAYQEAWKDYQETVYGEESDLSWSSGMAVSDDGKETVNILKVIIEKIDNILHFASPK